MVGAAVVDLLRQKSVETELGPLCAFVPTPRLKLLLIIGEVHKMTANWGRNKSYTGRKGAHQALNGGEIAGRAVQLP